MESSKNKQTKDTDAILSQWQTCVEMANSVSQRRDNMNNIFVTLNLAIIAAVSAVWSTKALIILLAGIMICVIWLYFIRNYKQLNKVKFSIINEMESLLPQQPFKKEWEMLNSNKKYVEGTVLERWLPWIFIALYVVSSVIIICVNFSQ